MVKSIPLFLGSVMMIILMMETAAVQHVQSKQDIHAQAETQLHQILVQIYEVTDLLMAV